MPSQVEKVLRYHTCFLYNKKEVWTDEAHYYAQAAAGLCRVVQWLKYSLGMLAGSMVPTPLLVEQADRGLFSSSHHTTTSFVTWRQTVHQPSTASAITATIVQGPVLRISNTLENGRSCWASPSLYSGSHKKKWKNLLATFQRGWSCDTAALCTFQAGQRPLLCWLHIWMFSGLLYSCQPMQHTVLWIYENMSFQEHNNEKSTRL